MSKKSLPLKMRYKGYKCILTTRYPWMNANQAFWQKAGRHWHILLELDTTVDEIILEMKKCIDFNIKRKAVR